MMMLMYVSRMTSRLSDEEIKEIAIFSAMKNQSRGVTGVLTKVGNLFLQVIEGEKAQLDSLMAIIGADIRHTEITVIESRKVDDRLFSQWNMAFFDADEKVAVGDDEFDELRTCIQSFVSGYNLRPEAMRNSVMVLPVLLARYAVAAHLQ